MEKDSPVVLTLSWRAVAVVDSVVGTCLDDLVTACMVQSQLPKITARYKSLGLEAEYLARSAKPLSIGSIPIAASTYSF